MDEYHKIGLIIALIIVLIISLIGFVYLQEITNNHNPEQPKPTPTPTPTPDLNEYDVRITEFEWTSDWVRGPVPGDWRFRNFITTIQNFGDIEADGLTIEVKIIANNTELQTGTAILYDTLDGVLYEGESRDLIGRVSIMLDELVQARGEWSNKIIIILDDLVLYELAIP